MTFVGYAISHGLMKEYPKMGVEEFDFRRASVGVTRHNQILIIDLILRVRKKNFSPSKIFLLDKYLRRTERKKKCEIHVSVDGREETDENARKYLI
jgi:AAA15 family ATPase/GTPase